VKKVLFITLKLCVSAGLLALLLSRTGGSGIMETLQSVDLFSFSAAVVCYLAACFLSTIRWRLLIPKRIPIRILFRYYMIGTFFNNCLPGVIGGDAVKAYYLSHDLKDTGLPADTEAATPIELTHADAHRSVAFASAFMDRYIGFLALIVLGMIAYPLRAYPPTQPQVAWVLPAFFCVSTCASIILAFIPIRQGPRFVVTISEYFGLYRSNRKLLCTIFLYSIFIQLLGFIAVFILAHGLALQVDFIVLMINLPVIILITLLPISISGIGVRESAFSWLLSPEGVAPEKAIALSLLWFLSTVVAGLWGLFEYLSFRSTLRAKEK
jgi:uncharacterized membrane protein YbhN (UPF0104 family)